MPLQIPAHDLHRLLAETIPFSHPYDDLPSINGVLLTFDGDNLLAVATDRFMLGISRYGLPEDERGKTPPFRIGIRLSDAQNLLRHAKTVKADRHARTVTIDVDEHGKVDIADSSAPGLFSFDSPRGMDIVARLDPTLFTFPNWEKLLHYSGERTPVSLVEFSADKLAAFLKVAGERPIQLMFRSAVSVVEILIGREPDFVGLMMPRRPVDVMTLPDWIPAPPAEEKS
ncbi:MAG TPA: hypothetical protein VJ777_13490 [Mycobacterium sp.]|nr:hypothetical protein [Mycobacterium sp.]